MNHELLVMSDLTVLEHEGYSEVMMSGPLEPLSVCVATDWRWPEGEKDSSLRLPTFTRALPRKRDKPGFVVKGLDEA